MRYGPGFAQQRSRNLCSNLIAKGQDNHVVNVKSPLLFSTPA